MQLCQLLIPWVAVVPLVTNWCCLLSCRCHTLSIIHSRSATLLSLYVTVEMRICPVLDLQLHCENNPVNWNLWQCNIHALGTNAWKPNKSHSVLLLQRQYSSESILQLTTRTSFTLPDLTWRIPSEQIRRQAHNTQRRNCLVSNQPFVPEQASPTRIPAIDTAKAFMLILPKKW
jgi:hypothetical protein